MVVCGFEGMCLKKEKKEVREWLSGGVSPCQGEGRGFESRLVLFEKPGFTGLFYFVLYFKPYEMFPLDNPPKTSYDYSMKRQ